MSEWRKIDGIENYEFSFNGKDALCKSLNYQRTGCQQLLSNKPSQKTGYINWVLRINGKSVTKQAGVWIAMAFPELVENEYFEGAQIDHKDTDRQNNHPSNLRWVSRSGNMLNPLTRKHLSEWQKGEKSYMWGRHLSEETKLKLSKMRSGENCYWYGKHHSEETKRKIANKKTGTKMSKESSLKKSLALRNNKKTSKPVAVFLKSGEYIDTYPSAMEAGKILNKSQGFISSCCRGEKASTEYIFKYV